MKLTRVIIGVLAVVLIHATVADAEGGVKDRSQRTPIYNPGADADAQITKALAVAKRDNKRVILMYGGNWCGWCWRLHDRLQENESLRNVLHSEYELVMIDIRSNSELPKRFDAAPDGYPYLTMLDADGGVLVNQSTVPFEEGKEHDPDKVLTFLEKWKPEPLNAAKVYQDALVEAEEDDKLVFVRLGAPWCGWCHRFDAFLAREEVEPVLSQDYVMVKIDISRMDGGKEFGEQLVAGHGGGIPWFAILDHEGKKLITSVGPGGNCGYPAKDTEIAYFVEMLTQTARSINAEQIATIEATLKQAAEQYRQ